MITWNTDIELFEVIKQHLFTAVVGDVMDQMDLLHQFLPPKIQPLKSDMKLMGRAMTVLESDSSKLNLSSSLLTKPFGYMLEALDDLKPNEVYLANGSSFTYALWGELMSTRAMHLGASGAVLNGYVRDTNGILDLDFPTFCHGSFAQDQGPRGKVLDWRMPMNIGQVNINSGDIVFGDIDGVLVIPQNKEKEIIERALEKALGEQKVKKAIESGMSAVEAFDTFGIM